MPTVYPIQTNFIGGEITPRLRGLVNTEQYSRSLAFCENFNPTPQGSLRRRAGTIVVGEAISGNSRLFNFPLPNDEDIMVEVNAGGVRLWTQTSRVFETAAQRLRDPTFLSGLREWTLGDTTTTDEISIIPGVGFAVNVAAGNLGTIRQELDPDEIGVSHTIQFTLTMDADDGLADRGVSLLLRRRLADGTAFFDSELLLEGDDAPAQGESIDVSLTASLVSTGVNELIFSFGTLANDPGEDNPDLAQQFTISNLRIVDEISPVAEYEFESPYTADQTNNLQTATDSASRILVFTHPDVAPYYLRLQQLDGNNIYTFEEIPFESAPSEWVEENYPGACEFFQGRLVLGGTAEQGGTVWGSVVGSIFDFSLQQEGSDPVASDGYEFTLLTNGVIQWLRATKVLLIGTEVSTWTGTGTNGLLSNENFNFERQSELGNSRRITPLIITDQVISVSNDFSAIRATNFDGINTNTYASEEISLPVENFFRTSGVDELAYVRQPFYQLFVSINNEMRVCMHDRITGLNAWSRWTTNGNIRAIASGRTGALDRERLWTVVTRDSLNLIEYHAPILGNDTDNLDGTITGSIQLISADDNDGDFSEAFSDAFSKGQSQRAFVEGLELYEGLTVQVTIVIVNPDGFLQAITHPDVTIASGMALLDDSAIEYEGRPASFGFGFTATATTLPIDEGNNAGTGQVALRHFNRIFARLISFSAIPSLNGRRPRVRDATALTDNLDDRRFTGDIDVRDIGTRKQGVITVEQEINLPTEISSLFGKVNTQVI